MLPAQVGQKRALANDRFRAGYRRNTDVQGIDVPMDVEKWIVGDEYDDAALAGLRSALRDSGYQLDDQWSAVAGSQDISHWEVRCPVGTLTIEVETYGGISVEGSSALVSALRAAFFARGNRVGTLD